MLARLALLDGVEIIRVGVYLELVKAQSIYMYIQANKLTQRLIILSFTVAGSLQTSLRY